MEPRSRECAQLPQWVRRSMVVSCTLLVVLGTVMAGFGLLALPLGGAYYLIAGVVLLIAGTLLAWTRRLTAVVAFAFSSAECAFWTWAIVQEVNQPSWAYDESLVWIFSVIATTTALCALSALPAVFVRRR